MDASLSVIPNAGRAPALLRSQALQKLLQLPDESALFFWISHIPSPMPTGLVSELVLLLHTEKFKIGKLTQKANILNVSEYLVWVRQHTFIILKHFTIYKSIFKCTALVPNTVWSNTVGSEDARQRRRCSLSAPVPSTALKDTRYIQSGSSSNSYRSWSPNWGTSISFSKILNSWTRCLQMSFPRNEFWSATPTFKMRNPRRGVTLPVRRRARFEPHLLHSEPERFFSYYRILLHFLMIIMNNNSQVMNNLSM